MLRPLRRYGSAAKQRWYKAQAAHNKGMLAQLPALTKLADENDHTGCDSTSSPTQPLLLSHTSDPITPLPQHAARSDGSIAGNGVAALNSPLGRTGGSASGINGAGSITITGSGQQNLHAQSAEAALGETDSMSQQRAGDRIPARLQASSFTAGAMSFPSFKGRRDAVTFNNTTLAR